MSTPDYFETVDLVVRAIGEGRVPSTTIPELAAELGTDPALTTNALFALRDDHGLVKFGTDSSHIALFVAKLTGAGQSLFYGGTTFREHVNPPRPSAGTAITNNVSSGGTVNQQIGDNNVQTITIEVSREQVLELIESLRHDGLSQVADEIDSATECGKKPGRVLAAVVKAEPALTAAGKLGTVLTTLAGMVGLS